MEEFSETVLMIYTYGHYDLSELAETATATFLWHILFYAFMWYLTYFFLKAVVQIATTRVRIR